MTAISVIMGVYNSNQGSMLEESIQSILTQTFKDFEFIICDDGSTDGTWSKLMELKSVDKRLKVIRNEKNQGLAATLNHCLQNVNAQYIARMDADDISLPNRFEKQFEFLNTHQDYAFVGSSVILFDEKGDWGFRKNPEKPEKKHLLFDSPFTHPSIMIRTDILKKVGGYRVGEETRRCEDYDLFMRLYAKGYKGYNLQEPVIKFRENKDAYSRRKYKFRIDEAKVRYNGFRQLGLMPKGIPYIIKPLIVGLIPQTVLSKLRREKI